MVILQIILFLSIGVLSIEQYMEYFKPLKDEILALDIQIALMILYFVIEYINYKKGERYRMIMSALFSGYIILRSFENFNSDAIWIPQISFVIFLVTIIVLNVLVYPKKFVSKS